MLKNHIEKYLREYFEHDPTQGQDHLLKYLPDFLLRPDKDEILLLKGYAGTGKTSAMKAVVRTLSEFKLKSVLLAPTGRAAKVLSNLTGKQAYTIHKKIYRQKSAKDGFGTFVLDRNLHTDTFFIVDEASMISNTSLDSSIFGSGKLLEDLLYFVYEGNRCKLILIGDTAQLPPIGKELSPALERKELEYHNYDVQEFFFNEVVRQSSDSGILWNATLIRSEIENNSAKIPKLKLSDFSDINYITGTDFLETLSSSYDKFGLEESVVVVRSNKQANRYNSGIRNQILWREEEISVGDLMMVVKNNYFWMADNELIDFIANGDIFEILKIHTYTERYGLRFADIRMRLLDYGDTELDVKIMLDTLTMESASMPSEKNKELYFSVAEDYSDLKNKKKKFEAIRKDEYFNALQVKFSYAITCHKAQGGQWKNVFIDPGYFIQEMMNSEYLRWLYTAFTRATANLYLVNFNKLFLDEDEINQM
ncbi:MAG: AAA family ATPase [Bacteroidales bacterium]|nr:AAA family ATPase [Bacteroidales bacterium]